MSETIVFAPGYKTAHCLIWFFSLAAIYPIYRVLHHVFVTMSQTQKSHKKGKVILQYSKLTKYFLLISIVLSYSYLVITSIQTLMMFINNGISPVICPYFAWYRMFSYTSGRVILYLYFISRANDIFHDTYLAFSKRSIRSLIAYILALLATLVVPSGIIYFANQEWYIASDKNENGSYCASHGADNAIKYVFVWGSFNDLIYSVITISMVVSRLFLLLKDNERKKSVGKRYDFASSSGQTGSKLTTDDHSKGPTDCVPVDESPGKKAADSRISRMRINSLSKLSPPASPQASPANSPKFSANSADDPPFEDMHRISKDSDNEFRFTVDRDDTFTLNDSRFMPNMEAKRVSTQIAGKKIEIIKVKVAVSAADASKFHKKTAGHNKLILVISKFFIILVCLVFSSQVVLVLFLAFRDMVKLLYSLDTFINMICLLLTFAFTDEYYNKYFCGKWCTPFCFPFIKTLALSLDDYEKKYQMSHDMNNWLCHNVCCIYCRCLCCVSCRYCCLGESLSKEIYDLAKKEIDLIIKEDDIACGFR